MEISNNSWMVEDFIIFFDTVVSVLMKCQICLSYNSIMYWLIVCGFDIKVGNAYYVTSLI